jgi:hypothetical protein
MHVDDKIPIFASETVRQRIGRGLAGVAGVATGGSHEQNGKSPAGWPVMDLACSAGINCRRVIDFLLVSSWNTEGAATAN